MAAKSLLLEELSGNACKVPDWSPVALVGVWEVWQGPSEGDPDHGRIGGLDSSAIAVARRVAGPGADLLERFAPDSLIFRDRLVERGALLAQYRTFAVQPPGLARRGCATSGTPWPAKSGRAAARACSPRPDPQPVEGAPR